MSRSLWGMPIRFLAKRHSPFNSLRETLNYYKHTHTPRPLAGDCEGSCNYLMVSDGCPQRNWLSRWRFGNVPRSLTAARGTSREAGEGPSLRLTQPPPPPAPPRQRWLPPRLDPRFQPQLQGLSEEQWEMLKPQERFLRYNSQVFFQEL